MIRQNFILGKEKIMKIKSITNGLNSVKTTIKSAYNEAKILYQENNIYKDIKDAVKKQKVGIVNTEGISDDKSRQMIDTSKKGLESYAKSKNINITFRTPKKEEGVFEDLKQPLIVSVEKKNGLIKDFSTKEAVIEGDTDEITKFTAKNYMPEGAYIKTTTDKTVKNNGRIDNLTADDNFLRRVYRKIADMQKDIDKDIWQEKHTDNTWNI